MAVKAVLNVATAKTTSDSIATTLTVTPLATAKSGSPTVTLYGEVLDLVNSRMKYSYLAYQKYTTATGGTGMAQTQAESEWISIAGVSQDFPNVSASATIDSSVTAEGTISFAITTTINYTATKPELHDVQTV